MRTMLALMRVDWRTFRTLVIGTVVLCAGPYVMLAAFILFKSAHDDTASPAEHWLRPVGAASTLSMICLAFIAASFGGTAWATERAEHSATFMALLPPTRAQRAASKLIVTAAWLLAVYAVDIAIFAGVAAIARSADVVIDHSRMTPNDVAIIASQIGGLGAAAFGVAWACSTFLNSVAISALIGCAAGALVPLAIAIVSHGHPWPDGVCTASGASLGVAAFLIGTALDLRRCEP